MVNIDRNAEFEDSIPGSLILTDADQHHANALHLNEAGAKDVILNPQPSLDVNDPLNWTKWRKHLACFATLFYTFSIAFTCSAFYAGFGQIIETRGISLTTLVHGTGYLYGFFGWGGLFVIPLALKFGQKPVYIASLLICMGMTIWTPYITTDGGWIASRIVFGFFGTPVENMNEQTIAMIYFSHERGFYLGLYAMVLYGGAFLSPVITGFIFNGTGLEGVCWTAAALCGGNAIFMWLFFEEVNFNRRAAMDVDEQEHGKPTEKTIDPEQKIDPTTEKSATGEVTGEVLNQDSSISGSEEGVSATVFSRRMLRGTPHSFIYKLGMFRETYCTWSQMFTAVWRPVWLCFRFPVIFYAGFSYGCSLSIYTIFTGTINVVLGGEPYGFGPIGQGLVYISPLIAGIVTGPAIGWIGDKLALKWARKNHGVREPEHRLLLSWALVIIVPWAFVQWGVGAVHGIQWFGLVFALGLIGVYSVSQAALSITYALDAYRDISGEVLVAVVLVRNTLTFGIGYTVVPLITNLGIQNAYLTLGFSAVGFILLFLPMYYTGKFFRRESKDLYWSYVENSAFAH